MEIQRIVLAGGCFWGVQELIRKVDGIINTEAGYCGGDIEYPTYDKIKTGTTGHAEAVNVLFNDKIISLFDLLTNHFFRFHDPTTLNRQGNDRGSQYRSAIFYTEDQQQPIALDAIRHVEDNKIWSNVVTQVEKEKVFWPAEKYHQDYLQNYPEGYNCHFYR